MRSKSRAAKPASPWVPPKGPKTKGPWNALVDMEAGTQWQMGFTPAGSFTISNHAGTKHKTGLKWLQVKRV